MKTRIAASIVLAAGIALSTVGCSMIAPQETFNITETSDGVSGNISSAVGVHNAVIISDNGRTGNLVFTLVNSGDAAHLVTVKQGADNLMLGQVAVDAGDITKIGGPNEKQLVIRALDTKPGALHDVYFTYGTRSGVKLQVPVLNSSWQQYRDYTPRPVVTPRQKVSTPSDTPTALPTQG